MSERLLRIAHDPTAPPINFHGKDGEVALLSGEQLVSVVFDGDAHSAGVTKEKLAEQWTAAFERAVQSYRAARSTRNIIRGALLALLIVAAGFLDLYYPHPGIVEGRPQPLFAGPQGLLRLDALSDIESYSTDAGRVSIRPRDDKLADHRVVIDSVRLSQNFRRLDDALGPSAAVVFLKNPGGIGWEDLLIGPTLCICCSVLSKICSAWGLARRYRPCRSFIHAGPGKWRMKAAKRSSLSRCAASACLCAVTSRKTKTTA